MGKFSAPSIEIPQYTPPPPQSYYYPWGSQVWSPEKNAYVFEEAPEVKGRREESEALKQEIIKSLGVTTPERTQQLQKWEDLLFEDISRLAVPRLSQELIGRGMGGRSTFYAQSMTDLLSKLGKTAGLERERLSNIDEQMKLQQLAALESGLSPQYARTIQTTALAQQGTQQREALERAAWNALLQSSIAGTGLKTEYALGTMSALGDLAGTLAMAAAMGGAGGGA